jgi:transcriptional regulator GlxA family with amidase domain
VNACAGLTAAILSTFPNTALTEPTIADRRDVHPATLRRAVAFIDEHAQADISIADIAAAANVSIHAVQLAFRRHLDMTPLDYLLRVRLEHAHHDLVAADSAHETVTTIAYGWGFSSSSRFFRYYREAYGVTPGRVLHGG